MSPQQEGGSGGTSDIINVVPDHDNVQVYVPVVAASTNDMDVGVNTHQVDDSGNISGDLESGFDITPVVADSRVVNGASSEDDNSNYDVYHSYLELANAVTAHEIETITKYTFCNKAKGFDEDTNLDMYVRSIKTEKDIHLFWQNNFRDDSTPIKFNGIPFVLLNNRRYVCHQGKDRDEKRKEKRKIKRQSINPEHAYAVKSRKRRQPSKKMDCPAHFSVKKVLYFPEYKLSGKESKRKQDDVKKQLRTSLINLKALIDSESTEMNEIDFSISNKRVSSQEISASMQVLLQYITIFPALSAHKFHHQGQAAGLIEPLDSRVREHVKTLVRGGVRRKADIISRVSDYVSKEIFHGEPMSLHLRRRFKPTSTTIKNIVASVKLETRYQNTTKKM